MQHEEDHEMNPSTPVSAPQDRDEHGATARRERRKRYPGILSKVASGLPEATAVAVLKGELAMHGIGSCRSDEVGSARDTEEPAISPESGKE